MEGEEIVQIHLDMINSGQFFRSADGSKMTGSLVFSGVGISSILETAGFKKPKFDLEGNEFFESVDDSSDIPPFLKIRGEVFGYPMGDRLESVEWKCDADLKTGYVILDLSCKYANDKVYSGRFPLSKVRLFRAEDCLVLMFENSIRGGNERNPVKIDDFKFKFGVRPDVVNFDIVMYG